MTTRRGARRGLTLVEVVIATAVMVGVMVAVFAVLTSGTDKSASMTERVQADAKGREFLQRISEDFQASISIVVTDAADALATSHRLYKANCYTKIAFAVFTDYKVGATEITITPEQRVEYSWELADGEAEDGKDENANGIVDEGQVRRRVYRISDNAVLENEIVLRNVTNRGFFAEYVPGEATKNDLTVRVEVFHLDPSAKQKDAANNRTLKAHGTRLLVQRVSRRQA
jgi:type II secretory pathway pseudopilin PulG